MPRIFISYRRDDSQWFSMLLHHELTRVFGEDNVFLDTSSIPLGHKFPEYIDDEIARCDCLVAVIGSIWLTASDEAGRRRLSKPDDYVRREIAAALQRRKKVIPLLIDGAPDLKRKILPKVLAALCDVQSIHLQAEHLTVQLPILIEQLKLPGREELLRFFGIESTKPEITLYLSDHSAMAPEMVLPLLDTMIEKPFAPDQITLHVIHDVLSNEPTRKASEINFVSVVELLGSLELAQTIERSARAGVPDKAIDSLSERLNVRLAVCPNTSDELDLESPVIFIGGPRSNRGTLYFLYEMEAGLVRLGLLNPASNTTDVPPTDRILFKHEVALVKRTPQTVVASCDPETQNLALIQRYRTRLPDGREQTLFYVGGSGVNGTAVAMAYLRLHWQDMYKTFGTRDFAVILQCARREEHTDVSALIHRQWSDSDWSQCLSYAQHEDGTIGSAPCTNPEATGQSIPAPRLIVFTDLDGTLLDAHTYSAAESEGALQRLKSLNIPIIFCSSKTRAEQQVAREMLDISDPFIVENGSAIIFSADAPDVPKQAVPLADGSLGVVLGIPAATILDALGRIKSEHHLAFHTFLDYSAEELAELTGLDLEGAMRAQQREYSAAVVAGFTQRELLRFSLACEAYQLKCLPGARFIGVVGKGADKGIAVKTVTQFYERKHQNVMTVGIGDSPNDIPMLEAVELPCLVQRPDSSWLSVTIPDIIRITGIGPVGFSKTIEAMLNTALFQISS